MELEQIFDSMENKIKDLRDEFRFSIQEGIDENSNEAKLLNKQETPEKIMGYFRLRKIAVDGDRKYDPFKNTMTGRLNRESIEETFFGMYTLSNGKFAPREVPIKIINALSENRGWGKWSILCLFNGIYAYHNSKKFTYSDNTLYGNVRQMIMNGIDNIKIRNRKYEKGLFLPHEQEMKSILHVQTTQMKKYLSNPIREHETNPDFNNPKERDFASELNQHGSGMDLAGRDGGPGCLF